MGPLIVSKRKRERQPGKKSYNRGIARRRPAHSVRDKTPVVIPRHLAWRRVDDQIIILNLETSAYWSLNEVGARIWELLATGNSRTKIVLLLRREYQVSRQEADRQVSELIESLAEQELLRQGSP